MSFCCGRRTPLPNVPEMPPTLNGAAATEMARKQFKEAAEMSVIERRISFCKTCPYYDKNRELCRNCGCFLVAKVGLKHEACPLRKW